MKYVDFMISLNECVKSLVDVLTQVEDIMWMYNWLV